MPAYEYTTGYDGFLPTGRTIRTLEDIAAGWRALVLGGEYVTDAVVTCDEPVIHGLGNHHTLCGDFRLFLEMVQPPRDPGTWREWLEDSLLMAIGECLVPCREALTPSPLVLVKTDGIQVEG